LRRFLSTATLLCFLPTMSWADGVWRTTETVDSTWAGTVQLKWNSATGDSLHSTGWGGRQPTWSAQLQHITWAAIAAPAGGWKAGPSVESRFDIQPHVVFGHGPVSGQCPCPDERHGVFLIDTYTGAAYVMTKNNEDGSKNFFYHDDPVQSYWTVIEEAPDLPFPPTSQVGRYGIVAIQEALGLPSGAGALGPYLTRVDRVTGRMDVAIETILVDGTSPVVSFVWQRVGN
jgi:hypothetical protein